MAHSEKTTPIPPKERIVASFRRLSLASKDLAVAADELGETISTLDAALKSLNLGVSAWHQIAGDEDENGTYWTRDIGYAKVGNKWGISIRKTNGNANVNHHREEIWLFADAPRWMCVESISKLPDLFAALLKRTEDTTHKLKARTAETREFAAALCEIAAEMASDGR